MQDFCFKTTDQSTLTEALGPLGLVVDGRVIGDFLYAGRLVETPGVYDAKTGAETTAPTYLNGEYAVYRATDAQASVILSSELPLGVAIVNPPNGIPLFGGEWLQPDLAALQAEACARIDARAEDLCNSVVTPGSAQMARYNRKQAQAEACLADPNPTVDTYPAIYNEVGITAETPKAVAEAILARATAWWTFGDEIEQARLTGKKAVKAAASVTAIQAAEAAVVWPALP